MGYRPRDAAGGLYGRGSGELEIVTEQRSKEGGRERARGRKGKT